MPNGPLTRHGSQRGGFARQDLIGRPSGDATPTEAQKLSNIRAKLPDNQWLCFFNQPNPLITINRSTIHTATWRPTSPTTIVFASAKWALLSSVILIGAIIYRTIITFIFIDFYSNRRLHNQSLQRTPRNVRNFILSQRRGSADFCVMPHSASVKRHFETLGFLTTTASCGMFPRRPHFFPVRSS